METKNLNNNENNVIQNLMQIDRLHHLCVDNEINKTGLEIHRNQHALLMYISKNEGNIIQNDIAKKFKISQAAVANTLKSLEKSGYVVRKISDNDTRSNTVCITEKGENVINKSVECFSKINNNMLNNLTETEINTLNSILEIMINNLIISKEGEKHENLV